jgi:hypothetical protein
MNIRGLGEDTEWILAQSPKALIELHHVLAWNVMS